MKFTKFERIFGIFPHTCECKIGTASAEICCGGNLILSIDCIAVENQIPRNMYERSALDYLIHNAPMEYAELIVSGSLLFAF